MTKLLNHYFRIVLLWDTALIVSVLLAVHLLCDKKNICLKISLDDFGSLITELLSVSVGIVGFVVTAITILIAFKSNTPQKPVSKSSTGMEMLMNSDAYQVLVKVFFQAVYVLVFCFILFVALMLLRENLSKDWQFRWITVGGMLAILAILRCIYILKALILVQFKSKSRATKPV